MEFRQLASFAAVVRTGSFSRAAETLFISQPSISTHIRQLEEEIGTPLLERGARTVTLTPAGKEFYRYADTALQMRERMLAVHDTAAPLQLRLGASTVPSAYVLPELIAAFSAVHPEISFHITQSDSLGVISGISERLFDLGFTGAASEDQTLSFTPLCPDDMVLIAQDNEYFRGLQRKENPLPKLLACPMLLREEGSGSGSRLTDLLEQCGLSEQSLHILARVNDHEAIKNMAACGMGVACVSARAVADEYSRGRLLVFPLPAPAAKRSLWLVRRKNDLLPEHVRAFIDFTLRYAGERLS